MSFLLYEGSTDKFRHAGRIHWSLHDLQVQQRDVMTVELQRRDNFEPYRADDIGANLGGDALPTTRCFSDTLLRAWPTVPPGQHLPEVSVPWH